MLASYIEPSDMTNEPLSVLLRLEAEDDLATGVAVVLDTADVEQREAYANAETEQLITRDYRENSELRTGKVGMKVSALERSRARTAPKQDAAVVLLTPKPFKHAVKRGIRHEARTSHQASQ